MAQQSTTLTKAQYERAWQLTLALVQNESSARKSLDMLFIQSARFVAKVDGAMQAGEVIELDTGKGGMGGKVLYTVAVEG
jgi:hypothetical protein